MGSHGSPPPLHIQKSIPENAALGDSSGSSGDEQLQPHSPLNHVNSSPFSRIVPSDPGTVAIDVKQELNGVSNSPFNPVGQESRRLGRSSVNVASIVRRDSGARKEEPRSLTPPPIPFEKYCSTGRVYEPEHFHGHRRFRGDKARPSLQEGTFADEAGLNDMRFEAPETERSSIMHGHMNSAPTGFGPALSNLDEDRATYSNVPGGGGMAPQPAMPKWPANWTSAAFEAVSQKRSYILSPPEVYAEIAHHGCEKAKFSWYKIFFLAILAGCYVGFGYTTLLSIGGMMEQAPSNPDESRVNVGVHNALKGAMGFPFAFTVIVVCGGELFTSMCAYTAAALWEGKLAVRDAVRMLFLSYFGNFIGTAIMVGFFIAAETFEGKDRYLIYSAEKKVSGGWGATLVKGILANWLVGIATWMANAAQDLTGKFVGIWLPISAFAAVGFEHCIANMFVIPMAISRGASINARDFVAFNLIPSTIGNWIGGAIAISTSYAFVYGRTPPRIHAFVAGKFAGRVRSYIPDNDSQEQKSKQLGKEG